MCVSQSMKVFKVDRSVISFIRDRNVPQCGTFRIFYLVRQVKQKGCSTFVEQPFLFN